MPNPKDLEPLPQWAKDLNLRLRQEWKQNRALIAQIGGVNFVQGIPTRRKAAEGYISGPGILDRRMELNAEFDARHIGSNRYSYHVPGAYESAPVDYSYLTSDGMRALAAKQIAEHKQKIEQTRASLAKHGAELAQLAVTDARTDVERQGGEPPHPPYAQLDVLQKEVRILEQALEVEQLLLKGAEEDSRRLEENIETGQENFEKFAKKKLKEYAEHQFGSEKK